MATKEMQLRTATTFIEYAEIVEDLSKQTKTNLWFRGQPNAEFVLTPRVLRKLRRITDVFGRQIRPGQVITAKGGEVTGLCPERMLDAFKRKAKPFMKYTPENNLEWMFIAQHHGLPTRLLDWTTNPLIALFFAALEAETASGGGAASCRAFMEECDLREDGFAIFAIDPDKINMAAISIDEPLDLTRYDSIMASYLDPMSYEIEAYSPICILAPHIATRIRAQSGVFTLHGSNVFPIEDYAGFRPNITKIFIPNTATQDIRNSLRNMGVTRSFAYPSLDSVAIDVADDEMRRHSVESERWLAKMEVD